MEQLNKTDYINVLNYYKMRIPKNPNKIKKMAEDILAEKLCKCIKKVGSKISPGQGIANESRPIAICTNNIFNKKGLKRGAFTCRRGKERVSLRGKTRKSRKLMK